MKHTDVLKQALRITWRYRVLWIFGFFLALCSGGSGGGGGNYTTSGDYGGGDMPAMPSVDPGLIVGIIAALCCIALVGILIGIIVRAVTRTALMGMVRQITESETVKFKDGWRFGWSSRAWRVFWVGFVLAIPVFIISFGLILLAFIPLLLLFAENTVLTIMAIVATIFAFIVVILILIIVNSGIMTYGEFVWRQTALDEYGVMSSFGAAFDLIKQHVKDVVVMWLLLLGAGIAWGFITFIVVFPVSLIAAAIIGGIPAVVTYLITQSWMGAAIAGVPLAAITMIIIFTFATGLFLIFQSAAWTLTYLDLKGREELEPETEPESDDSLDSSTPPEPLPQP